MSTCLQIEGRWFNRNISENDRQKIENAQSRDKVSSAWGQLADWFCGTNKEKAKALLFDLIHNNNNAQQTVKLSDEQIMEKFQKLQELASPAYKDHFKYETEGQCLKLSINDIDWSFLMAFNADLSDKIINSLTEEHKDESLENVKTILNGDIGRDNYTVTTPEGTNVPFTVDNKDRFLDECATDYQRRMVALLATQCSTLSIFHALATQDNRYLTLVEGDKTNHYKLQRLSSGDVMVEITYTNNVVDEMKKKICAASNYLLETKIHAVFIVGKESSHCAWITHTER